MLKAGPPCICANTCGSAWLLCTVQAFGRRKYAYILLMNSNPEEAAAMVAATTANLARCKPGLTSVTLEEVKLHYMGPYCPLIFDLLAFIPEGAEKLSVVGASMGEGELEHLAGAGSFASRVRELGVCSDLSPSFFSPGLWDVLPNVRALGLDDPSFGWGESIRRIVECMAAAPHPIVLSGPQISKDSRKMSKLRKQLMALPGGKARVEGIS